MDEPNISMLLPCKDFEEGSNKQHLANMLQAQGINLYPSSNFSVSIEFKTIHLIIAQDRNFICESP